MIGNICESESTFNPIFFNPLENFLIFFHNFFLFLSLFDSNLFVASEINIPGNADV